MKRRETQLAGFGNFPPARLFVLAAVFIIRVLAGKPTSESN
jgi:hypothetical protein